MTPFERAVDLVIRSEDETGAGVVTNDANDPGGVTKWGISKRSYPELDISSLSRADAVAIYRRDYWDKIKGSELPSTVAVLVFDAAVNQGAKTAIKLLQKAARVPADGALGPTTLAAVWRDYDEVAARFFAKRLVRYSQLATFSLYGEGWIARTARALLAV